MFELDDFTIMEELPMMEGSRRMRWVNPGRSGRAFSYHHGCTHGDKPRTKR